MKTNLIILLIGIAFVGCGTDEVIDVVGKNIDSNPNGPATYTIYTNLTSLSDSSRLHQYSEDLLTGRHNGSSIGFYSSKEGTPTVNKNHGIESNGKKESIIAVYRYNVDMKEFKLEYIQNEK